MSKGMLAGVVLLVLVLGSLFFLSQKLEEDTPVQETENNEEIGNRKNQPTDYGFSYTYRTGDDGYAVFTPEDAVRGDLVFIQSLFRRGEYEDLLRSDVPREAPVGLTLSVYRNPLNKDTREWITQTEASNYRLSPDGTISTVTLGSNEYLSYQFDGLYRADAYVYGVNGYIYFFTNMWENPESNMKKDMEEVLSSLVWGTPVVPAQTAHGDIAVSSPSYNEKIQSPLAVEGMARGNWYFEASFPVTLVDEDGKIIAEGIAQAQSDWMTEALVPFKAELVFIAPQSDNHGKLILRKDNASGLPENDDAIELPILFK